MKLPYVYDLIDPRDGEIFYVGKGRNKRAWAHERAVRMGREPNDKKRGKIQSIIDAGLSVEVRIVSEYATDSLAYDAERALVRNIGLSNLTNLVPGGGGYPVIQVTRVDWEYVLLKSWGMMKAIRRLSRNMPLKAGVGFFGILTDLYGHVSLHIPTN